MTLALSMIGAIGLLASCGNDEPVKPTDETKNKLHEAPFAATYTLAEAELSSPEVFDQNPTLQNAKPTGSVQKINFILTEDKGWHIPESSPSKAFKVKTMQDSPNTVYILSIEYFNAKGEPMNDQFIDNGQDKIHQHFFSYYDKRGLIVKDKEKLPHDYRYADTTPWNSTMGAHTGDRNPIGFKGLIRFLGEKSFLLNADLVHAFETKYEPDGSTSPFYAPSSGLRGKSDQDVSVKLPIEIGQEEGGNAGDNTGDNPNNGGAEIPSPTPTPSDPLDDKLAEGEFGKLNITKAVKMVIKLYEGHLHEPDNYHHVSGPVMPTPNLRMEQEMVLLYKDGVWRSAENTTYAVVETKDEDDEVVLSRGPKTLHLDRLFFKGSKVFKGLPNPVYGCWIEYYDAENKKINTEFVAPGAYQHFFTLTEVEALAKPKLEKSQTSELMIYKYKDTTPWDKSAYKRKAKYTAEPLGLKGYFNFISTGFKARLNIELRKGGSATPYHEPNDGEVMLKVSIPVYVPYRVNEVESFASLEPGDTWDNLSEEQKAMADLLISMLNISGREELVTSLIYLYNGDRGREKDGIWF